jgi:phosphonate transport system substrate-binding protein
MQTTLRVATLLRLPLLMLLFAAALSGCDSTTDSASSDSSPTTLRFADTGIEGLEEMRRAFGPFVEEMERLTGVKVEFFPVGSRTMAATALQFDQVDLVLAGPTEYIFIRARQDVTPVVGIDREKYYSVFIVPADSPAQSLADLRGKVIGMKDVGSTSGHVMPSAMLIEAGLDPRRDVEIRMLGGTRIEALLNGDVDALADGVRIWDQIERRAPGRFRIIAESPALPRDVLVARGGLPKEVVERLRASMIAEGETLMQAMLSPAQRDRYTGGRFVPVTDSDYDDLRRTHEALGLPFDAE